MLSAVGYITRNADDHELPLNLARNASVSDVDTGREDVTGRAAAGWACSFNREEQCSSLFLSYRPPLREELLRSFQS